MSACHRNVHFSSADTHFNNTMWSKNSKVFMEVRVSVHQTATSHYPVPDEPIPHSHIQFFKIYFNTLLSLSRYYKWSSCFMSSDQHSVWTSNLSYACHNFLSSQPPQFNYDSKTLWRVRQEIRGEKHLSYYNNRKKNSVKTENFYKTWGSHSSVVKDSVLGHQTVLLSMQFLMLWMTVVPVCPASSWTVKMKAL